jgi:glycosyltransferase involved in cell wall biosynthesis
VLERSPETPVQVLWIVANPEAHQDARVRFAAFCEEFPQLQGRLSLHCIASYDELRVAVGALDLFLGLSFSLFREAPLALLLSLRFGVPSISSEFGAVREIPLTVVPQVTVGRDESGVATLLLERLLSDPRLRQELSHTSIEYAELVHSPNMGAEDLRRLIEEYGVFNWGAQEYTVQQANRTQP